jgi:hypothetical protein
VEIVFLDDVVEIDEGLRLLDSVFLPWIREQIFWRISSPGVQALPGEPSSSIVVLYHLPSIPRTAYIQSGRMHSVLQIVDEMMLVWWRGNEERDLKSGIS